MGTMEDEARAIELYTEKKKDYGTEAIDLGDVELDWVLHQQMLQTEQSDELAQALQESYIEYKKANADAQNINPMEEFKEITGFPKQNEKTDESGNSQESQAHLDDEIGSIGKIEDDIETNQTIYSKNPKPYDLLN